MEGHSCVLISEVRSWLTSIGDLWLYFLAVCQMRRRKNNNNSRSSSWENALLFHSLVRNLEFISQMSFILPWISSRRHVPSRSLEFPQFRLQFDQDPNRLSFFSPAVSASVARLPSLSFKRRMSASNARL